MPIIVKELFTDIRYASGLFIETGTQYNTWSLRGTQKGLPRYTRHVPSFDTEW
ncbi:hypothetical protein EDC44_1092 [Cricetibacter osteomyelitidis]|uniref:Uncharacterized protein n=1 Tax=Cricetibacter osteomyelitidis TaxID=1521931 RepID=A0A4R2T1S2_9PAST|nr:hypothetical protein [Cricetibacter osteomyelitidis]TCP95311.1 hypothetical protein EDC44_1092 [Cricetibacter osteomyelitidis]